MKVLTIQEVADKYYKLAKDGHWSKIHDKLYHEDVWSIEAPIAHTAPVHGLSAVRNKGLEWSANIKKVHSGYCHEPILAGTHFACAMGTTYTDQKDQSQQLDEVCVFEVKEGKIVKEQFFY
jgi:hypothetical protein